MGNPENDLHQAPGLTGASSITTLLGQQIIFFGAGYALIYFFARDLAINPALLVGKLGSGVIMGTGLAVALILLAIAAYTLLPRLMGELEDQIIELYDKLGLKLGWPTIIAISLAAGICEEMLFRAGLMKGLFADMPSFAQVLISAFIFGIMHAVTRLYFVYAFIIGIILGSVYLLTGSLLAVVIAHIIYDIWALRRLRPMLARNRVANASPTSHSP